MKSIENIIFPPVIELEVKSTSCSYSHKFLNVKNYEVVATYPDEIISSPFQVEVIERVKQDAVVILGHYFREQRYVYLRSVFRPAIILRDYKESEIQESKEIGNWYELPAGLVESNEKGLKGIKRTAAREFEEEVGFSINTSHFHFLGHRTFTSPGMSAERLFFLEVEVNPLERKEPSLDGSPMEQGGQVTSISLAQAKEYLKQGYFADAKTEIGINRLLEKYEVKK